LIEEGPELRRRFIDWNLFSTRPFYGRLFGEFRRIAQQRNAWLRLGGKGVAVWDRPYIEICRKVNSERMAYFDLFRDVFLMECAEIAMFPKGLGLDWVAGFNPESMEAGLNRMREADLRRGYTYLSPDRADFKLTGLTTGVRSRGENKGMAIMLQIAAAKLRAENHGQEIWLIDDLASELSTENAGIFLEAIRKSGGQMFLTGLERGRVDAEQVFHVERGVFR
jgi:DNA replication and repair protein RecF